MPPTILMQPTDLPPANGGPNVDPKGAFVLSFQGFTEGQEIEVSFFEINASLKANDHSRDTKLGSVKGTITKHADTPIGPLFTLTPTSNTPETFGKARISFSFPIAGERERRSFLYDIRPSANADRNEGDYWEIQAQVTNPEVRSATFNVARINRALPTRTADPKATYDWHAGNDVVLYHDGSVDSGGSAGAFADLDAAIDAAQHFIFIADWSFHPYMRLHPSAPADISSTIGKKLVDKAKANDKMLIAIHTWDHTNMGADDAENDTGQEILADIDGTDRPANLLWRASSRTGEGGGAGFGWSHHQKFVVLDCAGPNGRREIKVFYGGLDLTKGRFDFPGHPILADATAGSAASLFLQQIAGASFGTFGRSTQNYDDWYNAEFEGCHPLGDATLPRQPWHDIHAQLTGPSAWDVVREFVGRWNADPTLTPTQGDNSVDAIQKVNAKFQALFEKTGGVFNFVLPFEDRDGKWSAQVYRSMVKEHWGSDAVIASPMQPSGEFQWRLKGDVERSIQDAYIKAIQQAERFIYIETQYFIGSGNKWNRSSVANRIPEEIANRICIHISNKQPFHAYIVMPMYPEGDPTSSAAMSQRAFEWKTLEYMIRLIQSKCDEINTANPDDNVLTWDSYLSFYFLAQWEDRSTRGIDFSGDRKKQLQNNGRYMIYVHSKLMIVDDRYVLLGSANLNERSLAGGRDSEICIGVWPSNDRVAPDCIQQIKAFRKELWLEHFGPDMEKSVPGWETPETAFDAAILEGRKNYNQMRFCKRTPSPPSQFRDEGHLCYWPLALSPKNNLLISQFNMYAGPDFNMIPDGVQGDADWNWMPSAGVLAGSTNIPE